MHIAVAMMVTVLLFFAHFFSAASFGIAEAAQYAREGQYSQGAQEMQNGPRIRIAFDGQEVVVRMRTHAASREFMALLPLTLTFSDYARAEKIATLPRRLNTKGLPTAREAGGDFTYYAPWGNLAVFYTGQGDDSNVYTLGHIESGKKALAAAGREFTATIELLP